MLHDIPHKDDANKVMHIWCHICVTIYGIPKHDIILGIMFGSIHDTVFLD